MPKPPFEMWFLVVGTLELGYMPSCMCKSPDSGKLLAAGSEMDVPREVATNITAVCDLEQFAAAQANRPYGRRDGLRPDKGALPQDFPQAG